MSGGDVICGVPADSRPATSFLWFSSPWKSFKHIIWRRYKWYMITLLVILLLALFLVLFLYNVPVGGAGGRGNLRDGVVSAG